MDVLNKIYCFFGICLALVGIIGGIGYACFNEGWVIAIAIVYCGYLVWPQVKNLVETLTER